MKQLVILILCILPFTIKSQTISLISPNDQEEINTFNPIFLWTEINNSTDRSSLGIIITEVYDGQSNSDAIMTNPVFFSSYNLGTNSLMYPFDAPNLRENQWYAWQIVRLDESSQITDRSEAWKFIIPAPEIQNPRYVSLQRELNGSTVQAVDGKLYFRFDENYQSDQVKVEVYNANMQKVLEEAVFIAPETAEDGLVNYKKTGTNYYELNLDSINQPGVYTLVAYDSKNQAFQLKFQIR